MGATRTKPADDKSRRRDDKTRSLRTDVFIKGHGVEGGTQGGTQPRGGRGLGGRQQSFDMGSSECCVKRLCQNALDLSSFTATMLSVNLTVNNIS